MRGLSSKNPEKEGVYLETLKVFIGVTFHVQSFYLLFAKVQQYLISRMEHFLYKYTVAFLNLIQIEHFNENKPLKLYKAKTCTLLIHCRI